MKIPENPGLDVIQINVRTSDNGGNREKPRSKESRQIQKPPNSSGEAKGVKLRIIKYKKTEL